MASSGYVSEELTIIWSLLIVTVVATYFIQRHKVTILPPSSVAMLLGMVFGVVARVAGLSKPLTFSPAVFFYALLPPIVFLAGFSLKKRQFFQNIGAITIYAIVGTFISALVFGLGTYILVLLHIVSHKNMNSLVEALMYGAAISSIDPVATLAVFGDIDVPPLLYNLVFGESVLNDAVAIVLFNSLSHYYGTTIGFLTIPAVVVRFLFLAAGSLIVGVGVALGCAFALKRFQNFHNARYGYDWSGQERLGGSNVREVKQFDPTLYELSIVIMGSYLAYLLAEVVGMSGIVALFFTGICHSHYSYYNVSKEAQVSLRRFFELAAFLCEMFVFSYLGLQVLTMEHKFDFGLFVFGIPLALLSRAANVFPCSRLVNLGRQYRLPKALQNMLWACGLRGAVAYGLVINMPGSHPAVETATLLIVVVSTLVLGSATPFLLRYFDLEGKDDAAVYGQGWLESGGTDTLVMTGGIAPRLDVSTRSEIHERFKILDNSLLKPLFGGKPEDDGVDDDDGRAGGFHGGERASVHFNDNEQGYQPPTTTTPLFSQPHGRPDSPSNGTSTAAGGGTWLPSPINTTTNEQQQQ